MIDKLIKTAAALNLPERFADDLHVHDRARLAHDDAPDHFGWILRASGTELLDARMAREYADRYQAHYRCGGESNRYYWCDRRRQTIVKVTRAQMFARMREHEECSEGHRGY